MDDKRQFELEENEHNYDPSKYRTPDGITSDIVIFTITSENKNPGVELPKRDVQILMVKRKNWPYKGCWALPGGFSSPDETLLETAKRELKEETGIDELYIEHLDVYSKFGRDPRGWIISSAYYALVNEKYLEKRKASSDALEVKLISLNDILMMEKGNPNGKMEENEGKLAFDHDIIIKDAYKAIQNKMLMTDIAKEFLDEEFTISELYQIIKTIVPNFNEPQTNFRRKILQRKIIEEIEGKYSNKYSKNFAQLYRFTGKIPKLSIYSSLKKE